MWYNKFLILNEGLYSWHLTDDLTQLVKFNNIHFPTDFYYTNEIMVLGESSEVKLLNVYKESKDLTKPDYVLDLNKDIVFGEGGFYYTENKLFIRGVYWELLPEGKTVFHNLRQTSKEMEEGLAEHLGIHKIGSQIYFGETCISQEKAPNFSNYWKEIKIKNDKYKWLEPQFSNAFSYVGTDKRGLSYYSTIGNGFDTDLSAQTEIPMVFVVAVLDPWTKEVTLAELPPGDWNSARNKNGYIAVNSSCIDYDGNFYQTDCNKQKGCYEIKKLSND